MNYSEEQEQAIDICTDPQNKITGVTGEAGTGKTTILRGVFEVLSERKLNICLAAPTGRATKRIEEATGVKGKTIHRMMRYSMPEDDDEVGLPAHNKNNPLPYDVILIDEASMLNDELYREVIDAMKPGAVIRFFGDANQLQPVQGISPFLRILERFPSIKLTQNFRSDDGIVAAARQLLDNRVPQGNDQFAMINPGAQHMMETINSMIDKNFRTLDCQVIVPQNKGKFGTVALNKYFQQKLNGDGESTRLVFEDKSGTTITKTFRKGDKIIWTKNDYRLNLFNGMIGFVQTFDEEGNYLLEFDNREVLVPPVLEAYNPNGQAVFSYDPRINMDLAYAITTHKSQGSEFDNVLIVLNKSFILARPNFYTAITRGKSKVNVVLGVGALSQAMRSKSMADLKGGR